MALTSQCGSGEGLRVNVGCGREIVPGWVNLDKSPSVLLARLPWLRWTLAKLGVLGPEQAMGMPRGAVHADAARRLPLEDESATDVYSSHMIEHMARWQAEAFLSECHRILVAGGLLRIVTPDLRQMARAYVDGVVVEGWQTPADSFVSTYGAYHDIPENRARRLVRRMASGAIHQWLYDAESIEHLLSSAGFTEIRHRGYREGGMADLSVIETRPCSLFVEARKPTV